MKKVVNASIGTCRYGIFFAPYDEKFCKDVAMGNYDDNDCFCVRDGKSCSFFKYQTDNKNNTGIKHDTDKPRMELLPFDALEEIGKVMTSGAKKYGDNTWQNLENGLERYTGALLRHLAAIKRGEDVYIESGLSHYSHIACNAVFMLSLAIRNKR